MYFKYLNRLILVVFVGLMIISCDKIEETFESETEKTIRIFTEGGIWRVDTLVTKTDVLSAGVSNITSDSLFTAFGTLEFQKPNQTVPGYGAGYMIHRYTRNGINRIDTAAWVPYNFQSGSDGTVTLFFALPGEDLVVNAYDMYLKLDTREEKKVRISGWRREVIPGGSGGSYGSYRRYYLTR